MLKNPHLGSGFASVFEGLPPAIREQYLDADSRGLTLYQRFALPVIRWFLFGQRGSGRSVLLAHVLIQEALASGQAVEVHTHTMQTHQQQRHMADTIQDVCRRFYPECSMSLNKTTMSIRVAEL